MATIKIYEASGGSNSLEFLNNGEMEENEMPVRIDHEDIEGEIWFSLSKEDAKDLFDYLKKQFRF